MKIIHIESATKTQEDSKNCIPEELFKSLKKLTVDEQMECIYVKQIDKRTGKREATFSVNYDPTKNYPYEKCAGLLKWGIKEAFVYDGVIIEVLDKKDRLISFGSLFEEKEEVEYESWDAHCRDLYTVRETVDFIFYLLIFEKHKYLSEKEQG